MPNGQRVHRRHIHVQGTAQAEPYTYPRPVRPASTQTPTRGRTAHADGLLAALDLARRALGELHQQRSAAGVVEERGLYLEFESDPGFELVLGGLDRRKQGIELVAVRERGDVMLATVFVPEGKLQNLERLITKYRDEDTARGQPKNRALVESIAHLRQAALESFWTDDADQLPALNVAVSWEVWLRAGNDRNRIVGEFLELADAVGLRVSPWRLFFKERTVVLASGTREQIAASVELLDCVAELRRAKEGPDFFTGLSPREQAAWIEDLRGRIQLPEGNAPAVCVLDTGVNSGHPLLAGALDPADCLACDPEWGSADHHGHGTEMAGLGLLGDLTEPLAATGVVTVEHRLESVKVLPPPPLPPNEAIAYGALTQEAMSRIEVVQPDRKRVFSMAVTTLDFRDRGKPSSWSAALDDAAVGSLDDHPRLVVLAAGNVERRNWRYYPDGNDTDQVHDPGQAWNALTVGACTDKVVFDNAAFPGWTPAATPGGLSPSSTTSLTWANQWPNKPDIVLEGGNGIREPGNGEVDTDDPLLLLTTNWQPTRRLLTATGDTSAASAQAARLAATIMARYPTFWPETVRGLVVHSAEWTDEMMRVTAGLTPSRRARLLLRRYGYGVPDIDRACWSASNSLTLVAEETLQPFEKPGSEVRTKDMNLHALPWPRAELLALGETPVELRVTLSYFIEPNPARRGWIRKFRYQSHGLRFAIRAPAEDLQDFRARVSKDAQDEDRGAATPDDPGWMVGPTQRRRGSIHSDTWKGIAADLAQRGHLAVYPVGGWWKERPHLGRWERRVRYSLVVTIKTPEIEMDIYTPVAAQVAVATVVGT